LTINEQMNQWN